MWDKFMSTNARRVFFFETLLMSYGLMDG